jgi:hypothetical protein
VLVNMIFLPFLQMGGEKPCPSCGSIIGAMRNRVLETLTEKKRNVVHLSKNRADWKSEDVENQKIWIKEGSNEFRVKRMVDLEPLASRAIAWKKLADAKVFIHSDYFPLPFKATCRVN